MRKLALGITAALALMGAGVLAWNAEATTLSGAAIAHPEAQSALIEKAGCWLPGLPGECEIGQHKLCDRFHNKACKCAPCPGWYPWRDNKSAH
jgi:hypothetical protein